MKIRLSQVLLPNMPNMEVLSKMLPTILDMKNAHKAQKNFQFSKSDRMTQF